MRRIGPIRAAALVGAAVAVGGCGGEHEFEPPDREEQVREAEAIYSSALFDTVSWDSAETRALEGNVVYSSECRQCHGSLGRGGTEYARERGLEVPSLVEPGWQHAGDLDAVRRQMFVGHPEGMPTWGVAGITPRQIDAAAYYILNVLRPDVLGGEG